MDSSAFKGVPLTAVRGHQCRSSGGPCSWACPSWIHGQLGLHLGLGPPVPLPVGKLGERTDEGLRAYAEAAVGLMRDSAGVIDDAKETTGSSAGPNPLL